MHNSWKYWRHVYSYTWAVAQRSSYEHFQHYIRGGNKVVLDIGTGVGEYIKKLPKNNRYIFTDLDPIALGDAEVQCRKHLKPETYELVCCDAVEAVSRSSDIDVLSLIHVISVVDDPEALISASIRSLRPGGILLIYISSISKRIHWLCNPLFRMLGFRLMDVSRFTNGLVRKKAGRLNDCYIYRKAL